MIVVKSAEDFTKRAYELGFSISALSRAVGYNRSTLSHIVQGLNGISPKKAKLVTEMLGTEFSELFDIVEKRKG